MSRLRPGPIVEVEWIDPGGISSWHPRDSYEMTWASIFEGCVTVGYMLEDSDRGVALVSAISNVHDQYGDATFIPRANVKSVTVLRKR